MYEDLTIEEKYLHNFSEAEKKRLFMSVSERRAAVAKKERQLAEKIAADDPNPFISWTIPLGHIACEIKYVLNRIAANDPKGIAFELTHGDSVQNADRLALDIANSFRNNTVCNKVVLSHIGLTDNGMVPLLHALSGKKLYLLDIAGNQVTDKSLKVLDTILANPKTQWGDVNLGTVGLTWERAKSFKKYPNLHYQTRSQKLLCDMRNWIVGRTDR